MADATETSVSKCLACGFEPETDDEWQEIEHPPLGTMTRCPECGSTDIHVQ